MMQRVAKNTFVFASKVGTQVLSYLAKRKVVLHSPKLNAVNVFDIEGQRNKLLQKASQRLQAPDGRHSELLQSEHFLQSIVLFVSLHYLLVLCLAHVLASFNKLLPHDYKVEVMQPHVYIGLPAFEFS